MSKHAALTLNPQVGGHNEEIVDALNESLSLMPDDPETWNHKGMSLRILNRDAEALEAFDKATHLKPDFAEAWWNKGFVLFELQRSKEGVEALDEGARLDDLTRG